MDFSDELINWYLVNKRDLPWRNTTDAYTIWLSEIILQQTRVEQGLPYFYRFIERYPDVAAFAVADEGEILKLWQGLGYYSRGRNMLKTARSVCESYQGVFPVSYNVLLKLKGIGEYTAAAISSFAANEARAVVDGNVYRVLARYFGIEEPINSPAGKKLFQQLADELLNKQKPALHNQAMMEFGAVLCKPKNPLCAMCPVAGACVARKTGTIAKLPVKLKTVKVRERYLNYLLITDGERILMNKRNEGDIWANMFDLPLVESASLLQPNEVTAVNEFTESFGKTASIKEIYPLQKHLLTHQRLLIRFLTIQASELEMKPGWFFADVQNLKNMAMPKIIFIFINNLFNL